MLLAHRFSIFFLMSKKVKGMGRFSFMEIQKILIYFSVIRISQATYCYWHQSVVVRRRAS